MGGKGSERARRGPGDAPSAHAGHVPGRRAGGPGVLEISRVWCHSLLGDVGSKAWNTNDPGKNRQTGVVSWGVAGLMSAPFEFFLGSSKSL